MKLNGHIDCHNHLAQVLRTSPDSLDLWLHEATAKGIRFFMQGGIDPQDWDWQLKLKNQYPNQIGLCFGVHPYFASTQTVADLDIVLDALARRVGEEKFKSQFLAIGEMGLDLRPAYTINNGLESQIHAFETQLELADWTDLPMIFHIVRGHNECERIFSFWAPKNKRGLLHSYSGSLEQANYWIERDFLISFGGSVCNPKNNKSRRLATHLPSDFLVLETDFTGATPSNSLWDVAKTIGTLRSLDAEEILDISTTNFLRIFGKASYGNSSR